MDPAGVGIKVIDITEAVEAAEAAKAVEAEAEAEGEHDERSEFPIPWKSRVHTICQGLKRLGRIMGV